MSKEPEQTPELTALEASLAALAPVSSSLDRDQLMFRAGQLSASSQSIGGPRRFVWPLATAAGVLVGAALGLLAAGAKEPRIVERVVEVPIESVAQQPASESTVLAENAPAPAVVARTFKTLNDMELDSGNSYFALRNRIVSWGADALPSQIRLTTEQDPVTPRYFELRDSLIHPDRPAVKPVETEPNSPQGTST